MQVTTTISRGRLVWHDGVLNVGVRANAHAQVSDHSCATNQLLQVPLITGAGVAKSRRKTQQSAPDVYMSHACSCNHLQVTRGSGRFLPLPTGGPLFEGLHLQQAARWKLPYGDTPVSSSVYASVGQAHHRDGEL
jgi:hypothetical protein